MIDTLLLMIDRTKSVLGKMRLFVKFCLPVCDFIRVKFCETDWEKTVGKLAYCLLPTAYCLLNVIKLRIFSHAERSRSMAERA